MSRVSEISEWYIEFSIPTTKDMLDHRMDGIKNATENCSKDMISNLVALCYGLPVSEECEREFSGIFSEIDTNFSSKNKHELILLAGATLLRIAQTKANYDSLVELLVLVARTYCKSCMPIGIEEAIIDQFDEDRLNLRMKDPNSAIKEFKKFREEFSASSWNTTLGKNILGAVEKALVGQNETLSVYREDSQVLWWMSACWSQDLHCRLENCEKKSMGLVLGKEAADLINNYPGPYSMQGVLGVQMKSCKGRDGQIEIAELIQNTEETWRERLVIGNKLPRCLQPLSQAVKYAQNTTEPIQWIPKYEKEVLGGAKYPKCNSNEYAWRFYIERLAEKCYESIVEE